MGTEPGLGLNEFHPGMAVDKSVVIIAVQRVEIAFNLRILTPAT